MFDRGLHYRQPAQAETGSFDRHRSRPLEPSSPLRDPEVRVISSFFALQRGRPTGARLVGERGGDQASDTGRAAAAPRGFGPGERAGPGELL